jgi:4-carboxymuconolactone decarboxylase
MSDVTVELAGRLPLIDPETLPTTQRDLYDRMDAAMAPWADRLGFQSKTEDGRYIGPFNPILFSPEIGGAFLALQHVEEEHTALSGRVRQIVILTVGAVWQSAYELYAYAAAGRAAGLSDDAVRDLAAGRAPAELNEEERIAQQFTLQLGTELHVENELYQTAASHFGEKGLVDMVVLAGCYHMVCSLLNAFAVPAPAAAEASGDRSHPSAKEQ